jgi:hypothetical protein
MQEVGVAKRHFSKTTGENLEALFVKLPSALMARLRVEAKRRNVTQKLLVQSSLMEMFPQKIAPAQTPVEEFDL